MTPCQIGNFRILRPAYTADHKASIKWLAAAHAKSETVLRQSASMAGKTPITAHASDSFDAAAFYRSMERHISRFGCGPESLASRGHDLEDFLHTDWKRMRIFNLEADPSGAGMDKRMEVFSEIVDRRLDEFYEKESTAPNEIIHVTCTGYVAPSAVQKLLIKKGWEIGTGVVHAYHMGCYAAMPALRMASAFLNSPRNPLAASTGMGEGLDAISQGRVDIVHTETCTLHLNPSQHSPEQLVVQSLFSDGHIRYSVTGVEHSPGLAFLGVHEELIPGSLGAMGWILGNQGMRMLLAREVPELIAASLQKFLGRMFKLLDIDPVEAFTEGIFAVHPGGPRIIDQVAALLELAPHQVAASRAVLHDCGNMSSATLPHIWAALVADHSIKSGTLITSLAFGPGLTVYGALMRKV